MISNGIPIGRVLGTELRIHVSWVLIIGLLVVVLGLGQIPDRYPLWPAAAGWLVAVATAAGYFLSVVAHEVAHVAVARWAGAAPGTVVLLPFGAAAPVEPAAVRPRFELAIAAAGPVASLVLGLGGIVAVELVASMLPDAPGVAPTSILESVFLASLLAGMVGVVNLLPVYPLDGARIVRALAWGITGDASRATRITTRVGRLTGYGMMLAGILLAVEGAIPDGLILAALGWVMRGSSLAVGQRERLESLIEGVTVAEVMDRDLPSIPPQVTLDTFAELLSGAGTVTAVPVMAGDRLVGVVGLRDIRRIQRRRWETTRATEVMAGIERLPVLRPDDALRPAAARLQRSGAEGLPVVAEDRLVGLLTRFGVGRALQERLVAASQRRNGANGGSNVGESEGAVGGAAAAFGGQSDAAHDRPEDAAGSAARPSDGGGSDETDEDAR